MTPDGPESTSASERGQLIFISDASAEADRVATALRRDGYSVVDVALSLLPSRLAVERPLLILCDADAEGSLETIRRLRDVPGGDAVDVVLIGDEHGVLATRPDDVQSEATATFTRPVDLEALRRKILRLVGPSSVSPPEPRPPSLRPSVLTASSRPPRPRSSIPVSEDALVGEGIEVLDPPEAGSSLPPGLSSSRPPAAHLELSPEINTLILEAERRVARAEREKPTPETADSDDALGMGAQKTSAAAFLPADVLDALDESLDDQMGDPAIEGNLEPLAVGVPSGTSAGTGTGWDEERPSVDLVPGSPSGHDAPDGREAEISADEAGTSIELARSQSADERQARQQASTPKPPHRKEGPAPEPPDRRSERPSTKPPSRPATQPPPSKPTEVPVSLGARSAETAAVEMEIPASVPPESMGAAPATTTDPSTAPPPRPSGAPPGPADPPARPGAQGPRIPEPTTAPPLGRAARSRSPQGPVIDPRRPEPETEPPPSMAPEPLFIPDRLSDGLPARILASAIVSRFTGGLAFEVDQGIRRVILRDGDFVTGASGVHGESLVAYLVSRGDIPRDVAREAHKLPPSGRHAGAALVARGHLAQDQLWDVLRSHAEWILGSIVQIATGGVFPEQELPGRLKDEPAVFGGATGAEVFVETLRRVVAPEDAAQRLGGWDTPFSVGPRASLLGECALSGAEAELAQHPSNQTFAELVERSGEPSFACALYALVELGVLSAGARARDEETPQGLEAAIAEIDADALRERIVARRALVEVGDYFSLLGVSRSATGYDIRRAYSHLRRQLDPSRALTPKTADLQDDLTEILDVLDEAYEILRDQVRRERYRRAIEQGP